MYFVSAEESIKRLTIASILPDAHVQCAHLIIYFAAIRLTNHILDDVYDKLRLHKDGTLQRVAAVPCVCSIVQH